MSRELVGWKRVLLLFSYALINSEKIYASVERHRTVVKRPRNCLMRIKSDVTSSYMAGERSLREILMPSRSAPGFLRNNVANVSDEHKAAYKQKRVLSEVADSVFVVGDLSFPKSSIGSHRVKENCATIFIFKPLLEQYHGMFKRFKHWPGP